MRENGMNIIAQVHKGFLLNIIYNENHKTSQFYAEREEIYIAYIGFQFCIFFSDKKF